MHCATFRLIVIVLADIVRLLLMVPIYASISLASYLFWVSFRIETCV